MNPPAYVDQFCFALGSQKLSVEESAAAGRTRTGADELRDAGFRYHHICDAGETAYDLARTAVGSLGEDVVEGIDAIVYATCIPLNANVGDPNRFDQTGDVKHLMDFPASRLQAEFGLERSIVIGLNQQACTSMLGSVRLAGALLGAESDMHRVLCLSSDRFPPGANYEQAYSLISDGAAACRDPLGPAAGNPYAYVGGSPLNYTDPSGLFRIPGTNWCVDIADPNCNSVVEQHAAGAQQIANVAGGVLNTVAFGQEHRITSALGQEDKVDRCSGYYTVGEYAGYAVDAVNLAAAGKALFSRRGFGSPGAASLERISMMTSMASRSSVESSCSRTSRSTRGERPSRGVAAASASRCRSGSFDGGSPC